MGPIRLFLALLVVLHHVIHLPLTGVHAVHVFFVMSGFLMAYVVGETYGVSRAGFLAFWTSRILRLYPGYWLALFAGIFVLLLVGDDYAKGVQEKFYLPESPTEWSMNIAMVYPSFWPNEVLPRVIPQSWALFIELCFYLLISLGLAATPKRVRLWMLVSLLYIAYFVLTGNHTKSWSYFSVGAGSLSFAVGAWFYHNKEYVRRLLGLGLTRRADIGVLLFGVSLLLIFIVVRWVLQKLGFDAVSHILLPLNVLPALIITAAVSDKSFTLFSRNVDRLMGDLSYPVYVSHFSFGVLSYWLLGFNNTALGANGFAALPLNLAMTFGFSLFLVFAIDRPIERLRTRKRIERRVAIAV